MIFIIMIFIFSCSNLNFANRCKVTEEEAKERKDISKLIWKDRLVELREAISNNKQLINMTAKAKRKDGTDTRAFIPIFEAVERDRVESFKVLLEEYAKHNFNFIKETDEIDKKEYTLLEFVIKKNKKEMFDLITSDDKYELKVAKKALEKGWENSLQQIYEKLGPEDAHKYALEEKEVELKRELEKGIEYKKKDKKGNTLLAYIVYSGNIELFIKAISTFNSIEEILSTDNSIIDIIIEFDYEEHLNILIEKDLKPENISVIDIVEANARKCLGVAIKYRCNLGKLKQFNKKIDYEIESVPLMIAVEEGHKECFEMLIEAKVDVNEGRLEDSEYGKNSLMIAAEKGEVYYLERLIRAGADVNRRYDGDTYFGEYGTTPLICAAKRDSEDCFKILVDAGADVDKKGEKGKTALMVALDNRVSLKTIDLLLDRTSDANVGDNFDRTALMYLLYNGDGGDISGYLSRYMYYNTLQYKDDVLKKILQKLLAKGADVNKADKVKCTPLMYAASLRGDKNDIVEMLIEAGAKVDSFMEVYGSEIIELALKKTKKIKFYRLLQFSHSDKSEIKRSRAINFLAVRNRNVLSHKGCTPLMFAAMEGNKKCLETLIIRGGNVNHQTEHGSFTALILAAMNGHEDCLTLLLKKGALITSAEIGFTQKETLAAGCLFLPKKILDLFSIARAYNYEKILMILLAFVIKD